MTNRIVYYIAILIGLFLVIVYYRGSTQVISTSGSVLGNIILFLQGRNTQGQITNYPQ